MQWAVTGIESSFCKAAMARSGSPMLRRHSGEDLDRNGTIYTRLSRSGSRPSRARPELERGGFVTEAHIGQREISNEDIIFRLFFEERFQFAARLSPTFLGGGMIAGDFLRPA